MAFSPDVNLGNVLTIAGTVGVVLAFLHRYDKNTDIRHESNLNAFAKLTETTARIERKVDENTAQTIRVGTEITAHVAEDKVFHKQFERALDEVKTDLKGR